MKLQFKFASLLPALLFVLADILYLYYDASVISSPDQIIRILLLFLVGLIFILYLIYRAVKNWHMAGLLLLVLSTAIFSSSMIFKNTMIILAGAIAVYYILYKVGKQPNSLKQLMRVMNVAGVLFLFIALINLWAQAFYLPFLNIPQFTWDDRLLDAQLYPPEVKPDIYYIVLDGYGREDILREYYGYDNSGFIKELQNRGFIVPENSLSNYPKTALSIASTLNMDYISNLVPELSDNDTTYWWLMKPLIQDSNARRLLEEGGYQSYAATTGWGITDIPSADVYYQPDPVVVNDFESFVLSVSPIGVLTKLLSKFSYIPSYEDHRDLILYNFEVVSDITHRQGAKFIFVHIVAPHPPFVFNASGDSVTPDYPYSFNDANDIQLNDSEYRDGYVAQLEFINEKIKTLIDDILSNSVVPPIIILQADHGPGMLVDFRSADLTCLRERFSIFAAYYLPGVDPNDFPEDITPVNTFRIVFNEYFNTAYPLQMNKHYYQRNELNLYSTEDVTSSVSTCTR